MQSLDPPQDEFAVTTASICKGCLDEIGIRERLKQDSNMIYLVTNTEYSTGECCFENCNTTSAVTNSL